MKKQPGFTTTADLPADIQEQYELTQPLEGGPVFDMPAHRQYGINLSQLTVHTAEVLIARKWPYLRRKVVHNTFVEAPAISQPTADQPITDEPISIQPEIEKPPTTKRLPKPNEKGGE